MSKYVDAVCEAIAALKERKGASRAAIKSWLEANKPELATSPAFQTALRNAIRKGTESGVLEAVGACFKLTEAGKDANKKSVAKAKKAAKAEKPAAAAGAAKAAAKPKAKAAAAAPKAKAAAAAPKKAAAKPKKAAAKPAKKA